MKPREPMLHGVPAFPGHLRARSPAKAGIPCRGCRKSLSRAALTCWLIFLAMSAFAQTGTQREYELKAGVLYHIIEYVEWPTVTSPSNQPPPIQIGLLGQIPFANALEVLDGKTLRGRKLVVKQLTDRQQATQCQVVFIG